MFKSQKEIFDKLNNNIGPLFSDKVITLSGKSGVGKSFVINSLKDNIQNRYSTPICYLNGDSVCQERDYYCFKHALNDITSEYATHKNWTSIVTKGVQDIPFCGSASEEILSNLFNYSEINQQQKSFFLSKDEQEIIYRLNYLFDKRTALIICDHIQYFDSKSLELLYLLITSEKGTFDFFSQCQFLLVYTDSDKNMAPIIKKLFEEKATVKYKLCSIQFEEMEDVLNEFKCKILLDNEIKKILFKLADGHLEVIKQIILQMNHSTDTFSLMPKSSDAKEVLNELITEKLKTLGGSGTQISQLLEYASLIGKTFSNNELSQIVELNKQDFLDAIKKSNEMELINTKPKYSNFSHDIIQLLFRNKADKNLYYYYTRMKECIKELYPAEYKQRIEIEKNLGDIHETIILASLYYIKREYTFDSEEQDYLQILSLNIEIKDFLDDMQRAFNAYNNQNYEDVISILNSIDTFVPMELLAEKDILKSISLTKLLNEDRRQEAITCLEEFTLESLNNEGDLYLRILLCRISAYSHMARIKDAQRCEKEIFQYLAPKQYYDDNAATLINILRRKANSMHECNYAEKHIKRSVIYFAPLPGQKAPLNPIQYLMSLGNHTGILIECGKFNEAYTEIKKAQDLVLNNNNINFPRLHIIDNNYLLSVYLSDNSQKKHVLLAYSKLLNLSQNADNVFILSNYCALLAVNGKTKKAYDILENIKSELSSNSEQFYECCVYNNLLVLKLYFKKYKEAQKLLNELSIYSDGIIDEAYYRKKYEIFQYVINSQIDIPIEKLDTFIFDFCKEYQESWNYWGRSFDYTALYYWSDM